MSTSNIDPALLAKLRDPAVALALRDILGVESQGPIDFAPFYVNKHGKVTVGHEELELQRSNLELTPITYQEAVARGLMTKEEAEAAQAVDAHEDGESVDLNNPTEEELGALKARAKELGVPNWHLMKAARLQGEIRKAELKLSNESEGNEGEE